MGTPGPRGVTWYSFAAAATRGVQARSRFDAAAPRGEIFFMTHRNHRALNLVALALLGLTACQEAQPAAPANMTPTTPPAGNGNGGLVPATGPNMGGTMTNPGSMTPSGGQPPLTGAPAMLKFCNGIESDRGPVTVELEIAGIKFSAASRSCAPQASAGCMSVPSGNARATVSLGGKVLYTQDVALAPGREYLVISKVDRGTSKVGLDGGELRAGVACAGADPFGPISTPPPGGTTPPTAGKASLKFCNRLPAANGGNVAALTIGNAVFTASPGECFPAKGAPCAEITAGMNSIALEIDGQEAGSADTDVPAGQYALRLSMTAAGQGQLNAVMVPAGSTCPSFEPN